MATNQTHWPLRSDQKNKNRVELPHCLRVAYLYDVPISPGPPEARQKRMVGPGARPTALPNPIAVESGHVPIWTAAGRGTSGPRT